MTRAGLKLLSIFFLLCSRAATISAYNDAPEKIQVIAWHPDGEILAIATTTDEIYLIDDSLQPLNQIPVETGRSVRRLAWSPDGNRLAISTHASGRDNQIQIWEFNPLRQVATIDQDQADAANIAWNIDGSLIAADQLNLLNIWQVTPPVRVKSIETHELPGSISDIAWSPDGTKLASAGGDDKVKVWSTTENYQNLITFPLTTLSGSVAWSPDNTLLAAVDYNDIRIWDRSLPDYESVNVLSSGYSDRIIHIDWQNNHLIATGFSGYIRVWNTTTWQVMADIPNLSSGGILRAVALSPDGTRLAYINEKGIFTIITLSALP